MGEEKFTLEQDDAGHWYVVPCRVIHEFKDWLAFVDDEEFDPDGYPEGVKRVGGAPSLVTFSNPEIS